jgi:hypothetical protein
MKKILVMMAFIGLFIIQSTAQYVDAKGDKTTSPPTSIQKMSQAQVNCKNNGIAFTVTGTTTSSYYAPSSIPICNTPATAFTGSGSWTGGGVTGFVKYTFSQATTCATVSYSAVNGNSDIGQITTDGNGTVSLSNACGASISANILTCNLTGWGDVTVKVSSTTPFTTITLTNTGSQSGWVQGNPCNFILNDCEAKITSTCCPPWNKDILSSCITPKTVGQGLNSPYQLVLNTSFTVMQRLNAYVNYLYSICPGRKFAIAFEVGRVNGPGPNNSFNAANRAICTSWIIFNTTNEPVINNSVLGSYCHPNQVPQPAPITAPYLVPNQWYVVSTYMDTDDYKACFNNDCKNASIWIRVSIENAKAAPGKIATPKAILEISDGTKIISTKTLEN